MNDFQQMVLGAVIRHGLTAAAGFLVTNGALSSTDSSKFIQMGTGIAMFLAGLAWSWWQKNGHAKVLAQLNQVKGVSK